MGLALLQGLRKLTRALCLLLLFLLIATPLAQIVMRSIFNVPMAGAEELARYFLICLTFIAAPLVTFSGGQIRMEEFQALIPPKPRWTLQLLIEACGVLVFALFLVAAVVTIRNNLQNQTATLEMPFWLFMAPLALGAALLMLETTVMLSHTWQRKRPEEKRTTLT
jgi:TRAP-type C4-dicarboxylate transport system permease small subunit